GDTVRATALSGTATAAVGLRWLDASAGGEARSMDVRATALSPDAPHWQRTLGAWTTARASRSLDRLGARLDAEVGARLDESSLGGGAESSPRAALSVSRGAFLVSGSIAGGFAPPTLADQ